MAEQVTADPGTRLLAGPGWQLRADWVVRSGGEWSALVSVRRGLKLLVTADNFGLMAEAWTGDPEDSDGAAVVAMGDDAPRLAVVPLCGCGERGCGNAGTQFGRVLAACDLPVLVGMLRDLDWTTVAPTRLNVLRGPELIALEPYDAG
jgi:hypothetical protein